MQATYFVLLMISIGYVFFLLLFTIHAIADLCKTRIPVAVRGLCICISFIIFLGASSVGCVDWYYRSVEMVIRDGYTFLKREYGPLHLLSRYTS